MLGVAIAVGLLGAVSTAVYLGLKGKDSDDIDQTIQDFFDIKKALIKYKKVHNGLCSDIRDLKDLLNEGSKIKLDKFRLSIDNKYIVVTKLKNSEDNDKLVEAVGGESYKRENGIYLSLLSSKRLSKVKPVAKITVSPKENITTTTIVNYDSKASTVEDGRIIEDEWKGNQKTFTDSGKFTVELRVKDKNDNWSEWTSVEVQVQEEKGIKNIVTGSKTLYAILKNGKVMAYGDNTHGQYGNGSMSPNTELAPITGVSNCFNLASSSGHTIFLGFDRKVKAAGKNSFGELGLGNKTDARSFGGIWGLDKVKQVVCGEGFSAALTYEGDVYTWGNNDYKQLAHSDKLRTVEMPKKINSITNVKQIAIGHNHVLCLQHDGLVLSWGENNCGELGLGFKSKVSEIVQSELKDIKYVCAGNEHSFAITTKGRVLAFGSNKKNELGMIGEKEVHFPNEILSLKKIVKIVTFDRFALALDEIGQVFAWGQFSQFDDEYSMKPEMVEGYKYIKDIAASATKGYMLTKDDKIMEITNDFNSIHEIPQRLEIGEDDEQGEL